MKHLHVLLAAALLASCSGERSGGVKGATGETPVRYVICGQGETNCFVAARFKDLESCGSHKAWADMLCDSRTAPGMMTCKRDSRPAIGVAHCTY
jgi:hypothetical protein